MPTTGNGGVRLHVERAGAEAGPVVVAAHGITDSGACWSTLVAALSGSHEVVVYDARGHGRSDRAPTYTVRDHVDDLLALLDDIGEPVVLLGHSMGGVTATWAAAERPDQVRGLIAEDPVWSDAPLRLVDLDVAGRRRGIEFDNARGLDELIETGRRDHPTWSDADLVPWAEAKQAVDPEVPTWLESTDDLDGWRAVLARVRCPVLLITGDTDVRVGEAAAADAQRVCGELTVVRVPDAGHNVRRDRPAACLAAVRAFLDRVVDRPPPR